MAKGKEKRIARILYVQQQKGAKEISKLVGVSEVTLSKWINADDEAWKKERNAKINTPQTRIDNIRQIINDMSEERISLSNSLKHTTDAKEITEIRNSIAKIDDAVSKWNKTLETLNKENQITLSIYIRVMEMIFNDLQQFDEALFFKTLDFQEIHLNEVATRFN